MGRILIRGRRLEVVVGLISSGFLAGCTGTVSSTSTSGPLGALLTAYKTSTLLLRINNATGYNVQVDLQVDGALITLPVCTTATKVCDYLLEHCPQSFAITQERWLNADGGFAGVRSYLGNEAFTFRPGEFSCGSTILLEFSTTGGTVQQL